MDNLPTMDKLFTACQYTVEPLIMDNLKSGQPPYNGHTVHPLPKKILPLKKGQPLKNLLFSGSTVNYMVHCDDRVCRTRILLQRVCCDIYYILKKSEIASGVDYSYPHVWQRLVFSNDSFHHALLHTLIVFFARQKIF